MSEKIEFMGKEVRWKKPMMNFLFISKWKLEFIKLLSQGPKTPQELTEQLPISSRTVFRTIEYLRQEGFVIEKSSTYPVTYRITQFSPELSELIADLFHIVHLTDKSPCATISAN